MTVPASSSRASLPGMEPGPSSFHVPSSGVRNLRRFAALSTCALVLVSTSAFKPATPATERNAILISWDGALREHVRAALAHGKLPQLARLARAGALVDIEVTGHQTDTKAGHAQMLTGYGPEITGVHSNGHFTEIPRGLTLFERLHQRFGQSGITTILLAAKDHNLGSQDKGLLSSAEPYHLARQGITVWDGDKLRSANRVGERALGYIQRYAGKGRFLLFVHFKEIDAYGHRFGESSEEYDRALVLCDAWLGTILDEVEQQGIADRTLVYVTADHGFDVGSKTHGRATHIFLGSNDPRIKGPGEQRDITPTVLDAMGVDIATLVPTLPGRSLAK
jgi:predicted AlkP superfamily pyrophosphatase or phosphodiesterase